MVARLTITADTNVYVSALHFGGKPRQLLEAARAGLIDVAASEPILAEIDRVLRTKFAWEPGRVAGVRRVLGTSARLVIPTRSITAVLDDPDDDRIIECAVASGSRMIVSGDKHLLRLGEFEGIAIVPVAAFVDRLAPAPPSPPG